MEPSLPNVLSRHVGGVLWRTLGGFALLSTLAVTGLSWWSLQQTLEQTADVVESLLGLYADPAGEPTTVAPAMLVDQLTGVGARFFITRRTVDDNGRRTAYFLTPDMPAKEIEGASGTADDEAIERLLRRSMGDRQRRWAILHRRSGSFDLFVAADRSPYLFAIAGVLCSLGGLLPLAVWVSRRSTRRLVRSSFAPVERLRLETSRITPADLHARVTSPTGWRETTELAEVVNLLVAQVERSQQGLAAFTADASHELRTPLTFVRAQAHWLLDRPRGEAESREAVVLIADEAERMHRIVEQLLLLARGDNNDLATPDVVIDAAPIVHDVAEIAAGLVASRPIRVSADVDPALPVRADAGQLRQILLNLVSNAARYTDAGIIVLRGRHTAEGVELYVEDSGIGISDDQVPMLFERFFRAESSRSRASGGAGLGLSIVQMLVSLHGGRIAVDSRPGVGSRFSVRLPSVGA